MAGKTPLVLASVLFLVGVAGLALTSVREAKWGPFQPQNHPRTPDASAGDDLLVSGFAPPLAEGLFSSADAPTATSPAELASAHAPTEAPPPPEPTPTPIPPLRVFGISADDAGANAASLSPTPPPPIRIGGVSYDDGVEAATPEATTEATQDEAAPDQIAPDDVTPAPGAEAE